MGRQEQLRKALGNGALRVLTEELLQTIVAGPSKSWLNQIDSEAERMYTLVDRGEAFSHAASSVLGLPIATGDMSAVNRLLREGFEIPWPILRFWDLVVFSLQTGDLDHKQCDRVRQRLQSIGDRAHSCFAGHSFTEGLRSFFARLVDGTRIEVGASEPQDRFDARRIIIPIRTS
jgi:hypothetical protein